MGKDSSLDGDFDASLGLARVSAFVRTALGLLERKYDGKDIASDVRRLTRNGADSDLVDCGRYIEIGECPETFWAVECGGRLNAVMRCDDDRQCALVGQSECAIKMSPRRDRARVRIEFGNPLSTRSQGRTKVSPEWHFRLACDVRRPLVPVLAFVKNERLCGVSHDDLQAPEFAPTSSSYTT